MKYLFLITALFLTITIGASAYSADFKKGFTAFNATDYTTAVQEFTPLAAEGNILAQTALGEMYLTGKGVSKDYNIALKWNMLAADQGNPIAQNNLAQMYFQGLGMVKNLETSVKWFTHSAEK